MNGVRSYATFYAGKIYFGISTAEVIELTKVVEITPVPLAPPAVSGLINLRGQIVTAIDMRRRLDLEPAPPSEASLTVLIEKFGVLYGLLVDRVSDILELDQTHFEPPPSNVTPSAKELIVGVYKLADNLLLVLDTAKLIQGIVQDGVTP
jgi:purine-binding chemotaxis protein CheW